MAAEGAESLGMPWSLGVANHATKVLRCLKATATRVLRRFSSSSAHPRPGLGLEVGIIGRWGYGVRAGSKRRIAVQCRAALSLSRNWAMPVGGGGRHGAEQREGAGEDCAMVK